MSELWFFSIFFVFLAGVLSHDRSVKEETRVNEWYKVYGNYGVTYYQNDDYTSTTFTISGIS